MPNRKRSGRKKLPLADLFKDIPSSGKTAQVQCTFCSKATAKNGTRMALHLRKCLKCPSTVKSKYFKGNEEDLSGKRASWTQGPPADSTIATATKKQQVLSSFADKISDVDQAKAYELLSRAIYASGTPLSIVENPYWKAFLNFIRPVLKLPTRYQLSGPLLQKEYNSVKTFVEEQIAVADSVAIMCDGWSNVRNESIINFVVTTPKPILYKTLPTGNQSHTAEYIANQISAVIEEIGIRKVFGVITDNASNMKAAWILLERESDKVQTNLFTNGCFAHSLNLIFSDFRKIPTFQVFLTQAVNLIKAIRQSHILSASFKEKQAKENRISLKLPVVTRWGSVIHCLESLHSNKQAITSLAIDEGLQDIIKKHVNFKKNILDDSFWDKVGGFKTLLKPVADAITICESDKTKISLVLRIFNGIEQHFAKSLPSCPLLKQEEERATKIIARRKEFAIHNVHKICNLLDPSIRGSDLSPEEQTEAIEQIYKASKKIPDVDEKLVLTDLANFQAKDGFFAKQFLWETSSEVSPTVWWKGFCKNTELSKIAVKFLQLPATSAACERSFSTYGGLHTSKRNKLLNQRAAKIVYIAHNLKLKSETEKRDICIDNITSTSISSIDTVNTVRNTAAIEISDTDLEMPSTSGTKATMDIDLDDRDYSSDDSFSDTSENFSVHDTDTSEGPEEFQIDSDIDGDFQ